MANVTTSIPYEIWNLAREKHISWSEALTKGIKELAYQTDMPIDRTQKIVSSTPKAELEQIKGAMFQIQELLLKKDDELRAKDAEVKKANQK